MEPAENLFFYKTIGVKAAEWEVSVRYIQNLCKHGKISGAIKKSSGWLIPDNAIKPSKKNSHYLRFKGTKKKIFEKAIELFSWKSYEVVTIKDIADEVGIGQSAVYNHFKSKQEILNTIYDFFCHYFIADRPAVEELECVIKNGSIMDIINSTYYVFKGEYKDILLSCSKLMFQRIFIDKRANKMFTENIIDANINFVMQVFDRAVQLKRLAPFDTYTMSVFCNMNRWYLFRNLLANPTAENHEKLLQIQQKICEYAVKNLVDLKDNNKS